MVSKGLLLGLLILQGAILQGASAATLELDNEPLPAEFYLAPYIDRYVGNSSPGDIRNAETLPASEYEPVGKASPLRPLKTSWFRFSIRNNTASHRSLVLDFDQALFSRVEWYSQSGSVEHYVLTGQDYPFDSRDIDYDFFAFRMDIPPGETLTANFSIYTPYAALFVPKAVEEKHFFSAVTFFSRFQGAIMGMLYAIFFFMVLYMLRTRTAGLVCLMCGFSLCCLLSVLYINGAVQRMLPDSSYPLRDAAYVLIHGLQGILFCGILRGFYQSARNHPLFDHLLVLLAGVEIFAIVLLPFVEMQYLVLSILGGNLMLMLLSLPLGILALLLRRTETYLFSLGLLLFILMAMISALGAFGLLPASFMTRYGYELGLTMQVDFLFLAVVLRLLTSQREKMAYEAQTLQFNAEIKARNEFVDKVTHDLKSPLTAVLGAEQLLRDEQDQDQRERYLDIIHSSSCLVATMIDDMLGYSRIQKGGIRLQFEPVSLRQLLQEIHNAAETLPRADALAMDLIIGDTIPDSLLVDRVRLSQLLTNLLVNAIKFTEQGSITLQAEVLDAAGADVWVRFTVADTGIGMTPEFIRQAFEPYAREDDRVGTRTGFGLGLAICKQLTELMGGTITVTSEIDKGSRFTVTLPFSRQ